MTEIIIAKYFIKESFSFKKILARIEVKIGVGATAIAVKEAPIKIME